MGWGKPECRRKMGSLKGLSGVLENFRGRAGTGRNARLISRRVPDNVPKVACKRTTAMN